MLELRAASLPLSLFKKGVEVVWTTTSDLSIYLQSRCLDNQKEENSFLSIRSFFHSIEEEGWINKLLSSMPIGVLSHQVATFTCSCECEEFQFVKIKMWYENL